MSHGAQTGVVGHNLHPPGVEHAGRSAATHAPPGTPRVWTHDVVLQPSRGPALTARRGAALAPWAEGQPTSFVLLDYLQQRGVSPQARVLELGCGWGLVGIACAKRSSPGDRAGRRCGGVSYLQLHTQRNGVHLTPRQGTFADLVPQELAAFDLIVGADICFGRNSWTPCSSWCVTASPWVSQKSWWRILVVPPLTSSVRGVCSRATRRCWPGRRPCPSGKRQDSPGGRRCVARVVALVLLRRWSSRPPCALAVSLTTVHALGLTIPPILRMLADEVMWWAAKTADRPDARAVGNLEAYNECTHACRSDIPPNSVTRVARKEYNSEMNACPHALRGAEETPRPSARPDGRRAPQSSTHVRMETEQVVSQAPWVEDRRGFGMMTPSRTGGQCGQGRESLAAARLCYAQGFYNAAVNRAYYAMFQAAQVALETAGFLDPKWSHAGLHATFANELTRRRKRLPWPGISPLSRSCAIRQTTATSISVRAKQPGAEQGARVCVHHYEESCPWMTRVARAARHTLVSHYLTEVSLLAKALCPEAQVEVTTERYEDEDGHVRIYPPAGCVRTDDRAGGADCRAVCRHSG